MRAWTIATIGSLLGGAAALAAVVPTMPPTEIKATFGNGKPFSATASGGQQYTFTFNVDGTALQSPKGSAAVTKGTWRVNDKGYCTKWGTGTEHCYTVERNGDKFDVRDSKGKAISRWVLLP